MGADLAGPPAVAAAAAAVHRGRLLGDGPIGVIDVGSNSVRLVLYERLSRAPTVFYNEKILAGLGRGVAEDGRLHDDGVEVALSAVRRFVALATQVGAVRVDVVATAATREAANGQDFCERLEAITGGRVRLLSGREEAEMAALGVVCGFFGPDGVVGDLGGGSLELISVHGDRLGDGESFPLGGLRLMDASLGSPRTASRLVAKALDGSAALGSLAGRDFFAVGGTWRALGKLHMAQTDYPVHIMHAYTIEADEALQFARTLVTQHVTAIDSIDTVSKPRRALVPYGAAVLEQILKLGKPRRVVFSALGVREGYLYSQLTAEEKAVDPLLMACEDLAVLRARSPRHSWELIGFTDGVFAAMEVDETAHERRLRIAACLLADIGWRAHPDYRGEQAVAIVGNSAFSGIDHGGRGYLALVLCYRYAGLSETSTIPHLREVVPQRLKIRARFLAAMLRLAYVLSAAMPGVLPRLSMRLEGECLVLHIPAALGDLDGQRVRRRLAQLASLLDLASAVIVADA